MTKVYGIKCDDFFNFIKQINEFNQKNPVIATQTHTNNNIWYAIIYCKDKQYTKKINNELPASKQLATKSQIWRIKKEGKEVPEGLTKMEASKIIDKLK